MKSSPHLVQLLDGYRLLTTAPDAVVAAILTTPGQRDAWMRVAKPFRG